MLWKEMPTMHVVVADSGQTMLDIISRPIRDRGDVVHVFSDGHDALSHIQSDPTVDILLTGLELKTMSGLELCWETQLISNSEFPIYIIVMSSSTDVSKLVEALDSGADDFLRKPFAPEELCARLRSAERVRIAQQDLMQLATTDPLTGVCNRRSFFERAERMLENGLADETSAMLMLDIDHFKNINDTFGHDVGDDVLRKVCGAIDPASMVFGRLGGEEFAAFPPGPQSLSAYETAEAMRKTIAAMEIEADDASISITCSFGISQWQDGENIDSLLKKADQTLYQAKMGGRNRTVIFIAEDTEDNLLDILSGDGAFSEEFTDALMPANAVT
jgi:two-component system cell cycle response regulator